MTQPFVTLCKKTIEDGHTYLRKRDLSHEVKEEAVFYDLDESQSHPCLRVRIQNNSQLTWPKGTVRINNSTTEKDKNFLISGMLLYDVSPNQEGFIEGEDIHDIYIVKANEGEHTKLTIFNNRKEAVTINIVSSFEQFGCAEGQKVSYSQDYNCWLMVVETMPLQPLSVNIFTVDEPKVSGVNDQQAEAGAETVAEAE